MDLLVVIMREHWPEILTGLVVPLLVGFVTKLEAHPLVKSGVNVAISAALGIAEAIHANNGVVDLEQIVTYILTVWAASHFFFKTIWKPAGGGVADPVQLATPDVGIQGPSAAPPARAA